MAPRPSGSSSTRPGGTTGSLGGFGNRFGAQQNAAKEEDVGPILKRLKDIKAAYDPDDPAYRFQIIVYNTAHGNPPSKPKSLTDKSWEQAKAVAPSSTRVPALIQGFDGLQERSSAQQEIVEKMKAKMQDMKTKLEEMRAKIDGEIREQMQQISENNSRIDARMMEIMQVKEIDSLKSVAFSQNEEELLEKLEEWEAQINKPGGYAASLTRIQNMAEAMKEGVCSKSEVMLNREAKDRITAILKTNTRSLKALTEVVKESKAAQESLDRQIQKLLGE